MFIPKREEKALSEFNRTIDFTVTKEDTKYDAGAFLKSKGFPADL
jgi:hypothetical protein